MYSYWKNKVEAIPSVYRPKLGWYLRVPCAFTLFGLAVGWLFFEHVFASITTALYGLWAGINQMDRFVDKQKRLVSAQFEQMLFAVTTSLQAGKSVENAFKSAEADLRQIYWGAAPVLLIELERMNRKVEHGTPIEKAVYELQRSIGIEEVTNWSDTLLTSKRTGGDLVQLMRHTSQILIEKMNTERELAVLIAGKKLEAKLLSGVPFIMIGFFRYGSPDYMAPLYDGSGRIVMGLALVLLWLGMFTADRIMQIEV